MSIVDLLELEGGKGGEVCGRGEGEDDNGHTHTRTHAHMHTHTQSFTRECTHYYYTVSRMITKD